MVTVTLEIQPLFVAPTIALLVVLTLSIIGNVLRAFTIENTSQGISGSWMTLWSSYLCSSNGCRLYASSDLSEIFLSSRAGCSSFMSHLRAAEAFGIISSTFSGLLVFISISWLFLQRILPTRTISLRGITASIVLACLELITFVLFMTLKNRQCFTDLLPTTSLRAAPFMYLGGLVFSAITALLYIAIGRRPLASVNPSLEPPSVISQTETSRPQPLDPPQSREVGDGADETTQRAPSDPNPSTPLHSLVPLSSSVLFHAALGPESSEQPLRQPVLIAGRQQLIDDTPQSPSHHLERERLAPLVESMTPIRVHTPVQRRTRVSGVEDEWEGTLWPDGDDWQVDEPSGLLWSESKNLFFDQQSGQFYDPQSDQWYNPDEDRWYKLRQ